MKLGNVEGRAAIIVDGGAIDVDTASGGRFGPDVQSLYDDWDAFRAWAADGGSARPRRALRRADLGPPVPRPARSSPSA